MANKFDFFIDIEIGGKPLRLNGDLIEDVATKVKNGFDVKYHADSFDDAFSLGTLDQAKTSIQAALGGVLGIQGSDLDLTSQITNIPFLEKVLAKLATAELRITDLAFNTVAKTFTIGLALDLGSNFTLDPPGLGLRSFGFVLTHT
jgi:hypothetical protein